MKILCENCQAKYSISDEKIRGKVFRIRCKKCSEPIIVRGDKLDAKNENEPFAYDGEARDSIFDQDDPDAVWFVLIDDEQEGPYTTEQIHGLLADGTMDEETYVWKEGFEDWLPFSDVPELQPPKIHRKVSDPPFARPSAPLKRPVSAHKKNPFDSSERTFTGPPNLFDSNSPGLFDKKKSSPSASSPFQSGGGLFDSRSHKKSSGMFSDTAAAKSSKGLFGKAAPTPTPTPAPAHLKNGGLFSSADESAPPQAQGQNPAAQPGLTAQRNESSVLFSLSNLQQLAANPAPQPQQAAGFSPGTEASGLIDIRTLASSLKDETETSVEDLLSLSPGGFSPAMSAPVLSARGGLTKPILYGLIGGVVLLLATLVILIVVLTSDDNEPDPQVARLVAELEEIRKQQSAAGSSGLDTRKELEKREKELTEKIAHRKAENEKKKEFETSRSSEDDDGETNKKASSGSSSKSREARSSRPSRRDKSDSSKSSSTAKASSSKKSGRSASSELDDLLSGSSRKASKSKKPQPSASSGSAKTSLSRSDVKRGMGSVASRIKRCGQGQQGNITLKVVIAPSGRVISAAPSGSFSGTSVGACAARAVRSARFPKFSGSNLTVRYPFRL